MRNNYRSLWAVLALFIITTFVTAQKSVEDTEALWEAVERSDEASVKALLSQRADPNSKALAGHTILMSRSF